MSKQSTKRIKLVRPLWNGSRQPYYDGHVKLPLGVEVELDAAVVDALAEKLGDHVEVVDPAPSLPLEEQPEREAEYEDRMARPKRRGGKRRKSHGGT